MPVTKVTMFFELQTQLTSKAIGGRTAGWTESWYYQGDVSSAISAATGRRGLCALRADLLPRTGSIPAQRYQIVDSVPPGPSSTRYTNFPGGGFETDLPQVALLVNVPGTGVRNGKKLILRGIPDQFMIDGEFVADPIYERSLNLFFQQLGQWRFRGQDFSAPLVPIDSITSVGQVNLIQNVPYATGDKVAIIGSRLVGSARVIPSRSWTVVRPTGNQFEAIGWAQTASAKGGNARKVTPAYFQPDTANIEIERATVRKVGRPFDLYRGRRRPA